MSQGDGTIEEVARSYVQTILNSALTDLEELPGGTAGMSSTRANGHPGPMLGRSPSSVTMKAAFRSTSYML